MTIFDYAVLGCLILSVLLGFWRGVVSEVLALLAWILAFVLGKMLSPGLAPEFSRWVADAGMQYIAAFATIVVAVLLLMSVVRILLSGLIRAVGLSFVDRLLGAVFGIARGIVLAIVVVAAGGLTTLPRNTWWREASLALPLETAVIGCKPWMPPDWAAKIRYR